MLALITYVGGSSCEAAYRSPMHISTLDALNITPPRALQSDRSPTLLRSSPTWGARLLPDDSVCFRLWAPALEHVDLLIDDEDAVRMRPAGEGWHELSTSRATAGTLYRFQLPNGLRVPDPASRYQPHDVEGPSEVIDPRAYRWRMGSWRGQPWHSASIYELHVGAFTPEGTFAAARARLSDLASLGVTAIELMPIGDFPGRRNWGYDGVLPYAPDSSYGRPEDLKAFIDAAHERNMMVLLDVVYNHFGPQGNYLGSYAPQFFTQRHHTPWGAAINFDGEQSRAVRDFVIDNALYWLEEFRFDGLRLDAVHHLCDDSPVHILTELAATVRMAFPDRHVHLILENEENEASRLTRDPRKCARHYTAQWNDDLHHVLHTAATREHHGYYADYLNDEVKLARAIAEGFAFQGEMMTYRGSARGEPSANLPPEAFIAFLQNHDQIGNRAFGERLSALAPEAALRAVSAIYLLLPQIPMLFMGEEWNAREPFVFFCDFGGELARAIRDGRRKEFAAFPDFQAQHAVETIPDPDDPRTFAAAKLQWERARDPANVAWRERYRSLLEVRKREIIPRIPAIVAGATIWERLGPMALRVTWRIGMSEELMLTANLRDTPLPHAGREGRRLWSEPHTQDDSRLEAWAVLWTIRRL
jgi:maltooligosyltrehalose trehalohydrolase